MLARLSYQYALLGVFLLAGMHTASRTAQSKKATPPSVQELVGVWLGFDSDDLTFTRLDLRPDSTGYCARTSPIDTVLHSQGVHVYRISKWSVQGWEIEIHMMPVSNAAPVGYLKGHIGLGSLSLTMGGPENGGWKEHLLLESQSRMVICNREASDAIEAIEKRGL